MKTPIQILMSEIEDGLKQDEIKVSPKELLQNLTLRCRGLLEKEKEVINNAYSDGVDNGRCLFECNDYYNETFNNEER